MPVDNRLRIEVEQGEIAVIRLLGELDLASAPALNAEIQQTVAASPSTIVIDLSGLEFMDSTGLRSLLMARESCDLNGRRFAVVPGGRQVTRLLEISRVGDHLSLISSVSELAEPELDG